MPRRRRRDVFYTIATFGIALVLWFCLAMWAAVLLALTTGVR